MAKLILHIGMQKTGTSALQYFLNGNRHRLLKDGFHYPLLSEFCDIAFKGVSYHNCIAGGLSNMPSAFPQASIDDVNSLRTLIDTSDRTIILSAEDFSRILDMEKIRSFLTNLDVDIIVYLRDQADWIQSMYNQRNKILFGRADARILEPQVLSSEDLFRFLEQERYAPLLKYDQFMDRWSGMSKGIRARLFSKNEFVGGNLITDFMHSIGVDNLGGYKMPPRVNDNLANTWIVLARKTAEADGPEAAKNLMRRLTNSAQKGSVDLSGETNVLSEKIVQKVRSDYQQNNRRVAREFFGRDELFV